MTTSNADNRRQYPSKSSRAVAPRSPSSVAHFRRIAPPPRRLTADHAARALPAATEASEGSRERWPRSALSRRWQLAHDASAPKAGVRNPSPMQTPSARPCNLNREWPENVDSGRPRRKDAVMVSTRCAEANFHPKVRIGGGGVGGGEGGGAGEGGWGGEGGIEGAVPQWLLSLSDNPGRIRSLASPAGRRRRKKKEDKIGKIGARDRWRGTSQARPTPAGCARRQHREPWPFSAEAMRRSAYCSRRSRRWTCTSIWAGTPKFRTCVTIPSRALPT